MAQYPLSPGYQPEETSLAAAIEVEDKAPILRLLILDALEHIGIPLSADEVALYLNKSVLSIRPRFSELRDMGQIIKADTNGRSIHHKRAIIWQLYSGLKPVVEISTGKDVK